MSEVLRCLFYTGVYYYNYCVYLNDATSRVNNKLLCYQYK